MNTVTKLTKANMSEYVRGRNLRIFVPGGYVAITRKALVELMDLYPLDCAVYCSQIVRNTAYLHTVEIDRDTGRQVYQEQMELPF